MFARPRLSILPSATEHKNIRQSHRTLDTLNRATTIDRHKSLSKSTSVNIKNHKLIFKPVENFRLDEDRQKKFQEMRNQKIGYLQNAYSFKNKINQPRKVPDLITRTRLNSLTDIKKNHLMPNYNNKQKSKSFYENITPQKQKKKVILPKFFNYCEQIQQKGGIKTQEQPFVNYSFPKALNSQSNKVKSMKSIIQTPSILPITFNKGYNQIEPSPEWIRNSYKPFLEIFSNIEIQRFAMLKLEKGFYFGELSQNIMQGKGFIFYQNGKVYQGNFQNGRKQGLGYENYPDNSYYLGNFKEGRREGKGRFQWGNGQLYDGQWKNGKKQGSGMWKGSEGVSYVGEWHSDVIQGFGVLLEKNTRYQGQFKNYMKSGNGTIRFQNNEIYIGQFKQNLLSGHGDYYWTNGDHYNGQFLNGKRHGKGFLKKSNGYFYDGEFQNDKKSGVGQQKLQQGIFYRGQYKNDYRHGWGSMICDNKLIYQGFWVNNVALSDKNKQIQIQTIVEEENSVYENSLRNNKIKNTAAIIRNKILQKKHERLLGHHLQDKSKQKNGEQIEVIKPFKRACNCQRHRSKQS